MAIFGDVTHVPVAGQTVKVLLSYASIASAYGWLPSKESRRAWLLDDPT